MIGLEEPAGEAQSVRWALLGLRGKHSGSAGFERLLLDRGCVVTPHEHIGLAGLADIRHHHDVSLRLGGLVELGPQPGRIFRDGHVFFVDG